MTICSISDNMVLIDVNGYSHNMSPEFVIKVLVIGWIFFIMAILVNCVYYVIHPMAPQVHPKNKLKTYLLGKLVSRDKSKDEDAERQALTGDNLNDKSSADIQND